MSAYMANPHPAAEPTMVTVSAVESTLEQMWENAAHSTEGDDAMLHAAAFTLIYAADAAAAGDELRQFVSDLTLPHPARVILLLLDAAAQPAAPRAQVSVYCHRHAPASPQICSELITLEAAGADALAARSTLLALRLSGLPTVLIWDALLPADHPLLLSLGHQVDRLITNLYRPCAPAAALTRFFTLTDALSAKPLVTDLFFALLQPWRLAVADLFDRNLQYLDKIWEIHFRAHEPGVSAELLLLAGWLSTALGWRMSKTELADALPAIRFDGGRAILFGNGSPADDGSAIEFLLGTAERQRVLRCAEPVFDNRLMSLLTQQLRVWDRDPPLDAALSRVREWLRDPLVQ